MPARINHRYELGSRLGEGGMGIVYRAIDHLTGQPVALKQVLIEPTQGLLGTTHSTADAYVALAREFQILATLRHPHVIGVLDYGFDEQRLPYYTMALLEQAKPIHEAAQQLEPPTYLHLLIQTFQALAYVHRRGILHRDLKPANILVTPEGWVYVLDFGLAVAQSQNTETGGTLAYLAPEVLHGRPPSVQSDLWSAGVVMAEALTGTYPFDGSTTIALIQSVLQGMPNLNGVEPAMALIIQRLLQKDPSQRYASAEAVVRDLAAVSGYPASLETVAVRESYLQAATFVGRKAELDQLRGALTDAIEGQGSLWLIEGESGVGKSRLMEELRIHGMVKGALVVRGQSAESDDLAYQVWREPLRRLVLSTELSDLEAGVLKAILPSIERLLRRAVPDAPELTGPANQQRLVSTIVEVFKRQTMPVVLLLEDLQWAQDLEPLRLLNGVLEQGALLVVGSYRRDEVPTLAGEFPQAKTISLERLATSGLRDLSISILGEVGARPELLTLLEHETEGNVYFVVEVLRALAEEAGSLSAVGQMALPERVFAGGIQQAVQRRLSRVPMWAYRGLQLAAVGGRELDVAMLNQVWGARESASMQEWLTLCADAAILDVQDEQWRFSHDKLREQVLSDLTPVNRAELHRLIAVALEAAYVDDPTVASALVEHWFYAGNRAKEGHYAVLAGQQALRVGAVREGIDLLRRALALTAADDSEHQRAILLKLGEAYRFDGQYEQAVSHFERVLTATPSPLQAAHAWMGLAWAQQNKGRDGESLASAEEAERLLRQLEPQEGAALAEALYHKGWALYRLGQGEAAQMTGEEGLMLAQAAGSPQQMAHHYNLLSVVYSFMKSDYTAAAHFQEQALVLHRHIGDRHGEGIMLNNLGEIARLVANYPQARLLYEAALSIALEVGDRDGEMAYRSNLAGALVGLGQYAAAADILAQLIEQAPPDWYVLPDANRFLAEAYVGLGYWEAAQVAAQQVIEMEEAPAESRAYAWCMLGQVAAALDTTLTFGDARYTVAACFEQALAWVADVPLDSAIMQWRWSQVAHDEREARELKDQARAMFEELRVPLWVAQMKGNPEA